MMTELEKYYNKFNEEKRLGSRHGQVEFTTSMKYIHEYLPKDKSAKILDVGAGTGRYSVALAEEGYDVTAVELVKYNLGILKKKNSSVKAYQGNADKHGHHHAQAFKQVNMHQGTITARLPRFCWFLGTYHCRKLWLMPATVGSTTSTLMAVSLRLRTEMVNAVSCMFGPNAL